MNPWTGSHLRTLFVVALLTTVPCVVEARVQFDAPFLATPTSTSLRGMAVGDFNEDGRLDVAANSVFSGTFILRLGDGSGQLHAMATTGDLTRTSSTIVSGDLNHDGHLDLVLAYGPGSTICVYLGVGNGTFGPRTSFQAAGERTVSVALADFNEDGNLDVAATTTVGDGDNHVCVWTGQGNGNLTGRLDLFNDDIPSDLVAADMNGDGHADLIYSDRYASGRLHICLGHGDGTFDTAGWGPGGLYPIGVACGDLNGDGHMDCVVANRDDFSVTVGLSHGDGTFSGARYEVGGRPYAVAIGDFNSDGYLDLAVADSGPHYAAVGNTVTILQNTGSGLFTRFADLPVDGGPMSIQSADLTGDGHLDLVVTCSGMMVTLIGNGDGTFGVPTFGVGTNPTALALVDLDRDGRPDVVTVNEYDATLSVRLGQPGRGFAARVDRPVPAYPAGVTTGDVNHDGFGDVVVAGDGFVSLFPGNGAGALGPRADFAVASYARSPVLADFDHDGNLDVVVAHANDSFLTIRRGDGAGGFTTPVTLMTPSAVQVVKAVDINGDGLPDLATANEGAGNLSIFRNLGGGVFAPRVDHVTGAGPRDIGSGDLDNDGKLDLIVVNAVASLVIFRGDGTGSLTRLADVIGVRYPQWVSVLDANHDGRLDLLATAGNTAALLFGNGDGTFAPPEYYGSGLIPRGGVVGDMDLDGEPDLVIPNFGNADSFTNTWPGSFTVLWNRGGEPVAVALLSFTAVRATPGARVSWEVPETATRHLYDLYRATGNDGARTAVTTAPLSGRTRYEVVDAEAPDGPVDYWLRETTPAGAVNWLGPFALGDVPLAAPSLTLGPNPARGPVTLTLGLPNDAHVRITVFDAAGRRVARLVDQPLTAGAHAIVWDRRADDGHPVRPGVYFVKLEAPAITRSEKLLLLN